MMVGLCNTKIGGFSPILTKKLTSKIGEKIGRFFCLLPSADFFGRWGNRLVGHKLKPLHNAAIFQAYIGGG